MLQIPWGGPAFPGWPFKEKPKRALCTDGLWHSAHFLLALCTLRAVEPSPGSLWMAWSREGFLPGHPVCEDLPPHSCSCKVWGAGLGGGGA